MIEIIPAILIFAMVVSASLRYFEIFRGAVEAEQVARNLMMAKIGNSGTMTTPASQLINPAQASPTDAGTKPIVMDIEGSAAPVIESNAFIDTSVTCFSTFPTDWKKLYSTSQIFVYGGATEPNPVQITTYASVCRKAP
jgi:hypothetical protein